LGSRVNSPLRIEPQFVKVTEDGAEASLEVSLDVLENNDGWLYFSDDPLNVGPEVPWVCFCEPFAGDTEWLARVTGSDEIHSATPRSAIEGSGIRVNRRRIQPPFFHARSQELDARCFPLQVTDSASSKDHFGGEVQSSNA
jgi:hypothetical protein